MRMLPLIAKLVGAIVVWAIVTRLIGASLTAPISWIIFALCVGAAVAVSIVMRPASAEIDPQKWSFDPDTGEYHRVTLTHKEGRLINKSTHEDRVTNRLVVISEMRRDRNFVIVCAIIFALSFYVFRSLYGSSDAPGASLLSTGIAFLSGCGILGFGVIWLRRYISLRSHSLDAGPLPVTPPGREEVERQKVHGVGGFATRDDIDLAARNQSTPRSANDQTFND
jgi:hypothetical protein